MKIWNGETEPKRCQVSVTIYPGEPSHQCKRKAVKVSEHNGREYRFCYQHWALTREDEPCST